MGFYRGPNIVTDGLSFAYDAGSQRSYNDMPTEVEVLVVAGGGGGGVGSNGGGGGGAGGVLYDSAYSLSSTTSFTVTVGAGGSGRIGRGSGTNGANSVFGTLTAIGGGRGGGHASGGGSASPNTGGSGGGGAYPTQGAAGTSGQGNSGGSGATYLNLPATKDSGGGGGGAGAAGANGQGNGGGAGAGGSGAVYNISGTPTTYAGGGGGATNDMNTRAIGGTGGGGSGGTPASKNGDNGVTNTGSGGGGGNGGGGSSGAGGSGVVIIRYLGVPKATVGNVVLVNGYTIHTFTSSGTFELFDFAYNLVGSSRGTLQNGVGFNTANGGFWEFDGVDDKIEVATFPTSIFNGPCTMEAWIYWNDDSRSVIIGNYTTTSTGGDINYEKNPNGTLRFYWDRGSANAFSSANAVAIGEWQHVIIVRDVSGNAVKFYVNGSLITTVSGQAGSNVSTTADTYKIGADARNGSTVTNGDISAVRMYSTALTAAQVTQNFNAQKSRFL